VVTASPRASRMVGNANSTGSTTDQPFPAPAGRTGLRELQTGTRAHPHRSGPRRRSPGAMPLDPQAIQARAGGVRVGDALGNARPPARTHRGDRRFLSPDSGKGGARRRIARRACRCWAAWPTVSSVSWRGSAPCAGPSRRSARSCRH
jgi:hypothetical protein